MSEVDPQVINRGRLDLDEDIKDEVRRSGESVVSVGWSESHGMESEPNLDEIRRLAVVSDDGVHLTTKMCGKVAGLLYRRLVSRELDGGEQKRMRASSY